jgi:F-type H+-transporting ATPase subunit gamma
MPSLKAVRIRIASVKATQKITRAMKLVAAAKLRRAQDSILAARPYARALAEAVGEVASRAGTEAHPMLTRREGKRAAIVVLSSDRGLCGAFNTNVCRTVQRFVEEKTRSGELEEARIAVVGRKGRDYFKRRRLPIAHELGGATGDTALDRAKEVAFTVSGEFLDGKVDTVYLVYNEFKSAVSQKVQMDSLLPVKTGEQGAEGGDAGLDFLYEPGKEDLLAILLPLYLENHIYKALLESIASEFGARMSAMENATSNASDMIDKLTLMYNRSRQASITKELMEIVGGAEALKG